MLFGVAPALFVGSNFQPFSQGLGQFSLRFGHRFEEKLCLGRAEARPSVCSFVSHREGKLETLRRLAQASAVSEKRILVVDDDTSLIRLIGEALRSRFRCEVDATPNPEYGFELALKKRYRVFVFDFSMPMIDGAMLFTLIGKVYNHVNPPIVVPPLILISGRGDEARAQELMKEAGVRGFLPKPFAMNRLMEKISEVAPDLAAASRE